MWPPLAWNPTYESSNTQQFSSGSEIAPFEILENLSRKKVLRLFKLDLDSDTLAKIHVRATAKLEMILSIAQNPIKLCRGTRLVLILMRKGCLLLNN